MENRKNPFVGLRPFRQDESHLFFGREELTEEVLEKLSKNHFAAIMGASGAGKSSFVYCSLLPGLEKGFEVNRKKIWKSIKHRVFNLVSRDSSYYSIFFP